MGGGGGFLLEEDPRTCVWSREPGHSSPPSPRGAATLIEVPANLVWKPRPSRLEPRLEPVLLLAPPPPPQPPASTSFSAQGPS